MAKQEKQSKPAAILEGIVNLVLSKNEDLASIRIKICEPCPHKTKWGMCSLCSCSLSIKVHNKTEKCPINNW